MSDVLKYCSNPAQIIGAEEVTFSEYGERAVLCKNGALSLTLLRDKCLDIYELSFKGVNLGFICKNGLAQNDAGEFLKYIQGGFLFTCGLDNIGASVSGLPMHGSIGRKRANITLKKVRAGDGVIEIEGEVQDSALFGKNLRLIRNYKIYEGKLVLTDKIVNAGTALENVLYLYHFNFGYPFLSERLSLKMNPLSSTNRDGSAIKENEHLKFIPPVDNKPESCYFHKMPETAEVKLARKDLGITVNFAYDTKNLPVLTQWKTMASGDYALGIEPTSCILDEKKATPLKPGGVIENKIEISFQ